MFEAQCEECDAVYTIDQSKALDAFTCLCGCAQFNVEEANFLLA